MWGFAVCIIAFLAILISQWVLRWWHNKTCNGNGRLPPGSLGFPVIGETIQFFSRYSSNDIPPFIRKRMNKYGSVFKTSLVGQTVVVSGDPEFNHYIFQQEGKSVYCSFTESFTRIMGGDSILVYHGIIHKYLKDLTVTMFGPQNLKAALLHEMDAFTRNYLHSCSITPTFDVKDESANMVFQYVAKKLLSYEEATASKKLRGNFKAFMDGLISFPLNIPGTIYHTCLKGRENAIKEIKDVIDERKSSKRAHHDFLDFLLEEAKKEDKVINEETVTDLTFALLFASHETTSMAITLAIKFLSDHPSVVVELTKEQEEIVRNRENKESGVTWAEYKSMTFTHMVINETLRLGNIAPGIFRRVIKDIDRNGIRIVTGSTLMVCPSAVHLNPAKYKDPLAFDPWRWEGQELHAGSKNFMAFGGGARLCSGAHFAKVQIALFLHYLVTNYRWKKVSGGEITRKPGLMFPNGLHIQLSKK